MNLPYKIDVILIIIQEQDHKIDLKDRQTKTRRGHRFGR
jgi:hypothetical protein